MPTSELKPATPPTFTRVLRDHEIDALSPADQQRYLDWMREEYARGNDEFYRHTMMLAEREAQRRPPVTSDDLYLQGDYDAVGSRLAFQWGE